MVSTPAPQPIEPLRVTPGANPRIDPIERWFVVLLRFIALLLLARSLLSWFILIGLVEVPSLGETLFDPPYLILSLVIVTATISVIAATGLWLLAPWGAVLWLSMVAAGHRPDRPDARSDPWWSNCVLHRPCVPAPPHGQEPDGRRYLIATSRCFRVVAATQTHASSTRRNGGWLGDPHRNW